MFKLMVGIAAVALAGAASADNWKNLRVDASSENAFAQSLAEFREKLSPARVYAFGEALKDIWLHGTEAAQAEQRDYTARDYYAQVDGLGYKQVVALADPTGETTKRRLQAAIRMGPAQPIPVVRDSWNQGAAARVGPNESRGYH
jgi:hypothetical protein